MPFALTHGDGMVKLTGEPLHPFASGIFAWVLKRSHPTWHDSVSF
jgi:hypothetical protein